MKKLILIFSIFLFLIISIFIFQKWYFNPERIYEKQEKTWNERILNYQYVEYIPIVFQQDKLIDAPNLLSKTHIMNVVRVLKINNEKWKLQNGKLLVSRNIDRETLWNYTTKANDSIWLAEHAIKN